MPFNKSKDILYSGNMFKSPFPKKSSLGKLPKAIAPPLGDIAVGTNYLVNPNLINIEGPQVTIHFKNTPAKEAIEYLISKVTYDYVWVNSDPTYIKDSNSTSGKIDAPRLVSLNLTNLISQKPLMLF